MGDNGFVKPREVEKESRLSVRVDKTLKDRLAQSAKDTGVDEATIVRQCLIAFCDHVEMHGRVTFPLSIGAPVAKPAEKPERYSLNEESPPTPKKKAV